MTSVPNDVTTTGSADTVDTSAPSEAVDGVDAGLIGKWHSDQSGETLEFKADGTLVVTRDAGGTSQFNYSADGSNISFIVDGVAYYTGTYAIDGDVMTMVDPDIPGTVYFDRVG